MSRQKFTKLYQSPLEDGTSLSRGSITPHFAGTRVKEKHSAVIGELDAAKPALRLSSHTGVDVLVAGDHGEHERDDGENGLRGSVASY